MAVRFAFDLIDRMSGPAGKISKGLAQVEKGLSQNNKALAALEGKTDKASLKTIKSLERQNALYDKQKEKLLKGGVAIADKVAKDAKAANAAEKTAKKVDKAAVSMKGLGAAAGYAAGAVLAATLGFAAAGSKLLLGAMQFRETTQAALRFSLGSAKAGQEAFGEILRISNVLGASSAEAAGNFRELTAAGFGDRESKILIQLADDLKAANGGQAVAIASLAEPLQALKRNEQLTADSFKGLEAAGMGKDQLYKTLAAELKVAIKDPNDSNAIKRDVERAMATQKLRGQKAVDFWSKVNMRALDVKAFGEKGKEFRDTTVTGALDKVKNKWESLLAAVNTGDAGKVLVKALQQIAGALDPSTESGKRLVATLDKMAAAGAKIFEALKPLGEGLGEGFGKALDDVGEFMALMGKGSGSSSAFAGGLKSVGVAMGELIVGAALVVGGLGWLAATIVEAFVTLPDNLRSIGRDMIRGLGEGLDAAKGWLVAKLESLAALLPESVRKLLQIRSPSRVMMRLGAHTAEGFAQGVERGAPRVEASADALVAPVVRSGAGVAPQGGSRGTVIFQAGAVVISLPPGAPASPEDILRLVEEGIIQALRRAGLELGAEDAT